MPISADPLSLTTRLGNVVVISSPDDQALAKLDWGKWVSNTALRFTQFSTPVPRRIFLLDSTLFRSDQTGVVAIEYARQDIQSADLLSLIGSWTENTLLLAIGSWKFSLSSWIESLRSIANAKYSDKINSFFDDQIEKWKTWESKISDDSLFVISDSGNRFYNASELCRTWIRRVIRSKSSYELKHGGWACCVVSINPEGASNEGKMRLHRLVSLESSIWCGDPNWHANLPTFVLSILSKCKEFWISLPFNVLTQDVLEKVTLGLNPNDVRVFAPSVCLGWHPVRDISLFLASAESSRIFVFMDAQERLQIIFAEKLEGS